MWVSLELVLEVVSKVKFLGRPPILIECLKRHKVHAPLCQSKQCRIYVLMATIFTTLNKSLRTSPETNFRSKNNFDEIYTFQGLDWAFPSLPRSSLLLSTPIPLSTLLVKALRLVEWTGLEGVELKRQNYGFTMISWCIRFVVWFGWKNGKVVCMDK